MKAGLLFPRADRISAEEVRPLWKVGSDWWSSPGRTIMVESTGEFRSVGQGEWYLSGAGIEGYCARHGHLTQQHWIGRLVRVEQEPTQYRVVARMPEHDEVTP